jgi:hypothetical protein
MDHLKMPLALTGSEVDADQAVTEQVVARAVAAVIIRRGVFDGQVDQAQFLIHGHLGPDTGVAVGGPGTVLPSVVAEFTRTWNRVESPQKFAGVYVERAH